MKIFSSAYARAMHWARHPRAPAFLAALSFAESSFFPVPPDVMLIPMVTARPAAWWRLAALTTLASVIGGMFGYLLGWMAIDLITPWLQGTAYWPRYLRVQEWFQQWGVWVVFVAGFSPIPYKLFTLSAGALSLALVPFLVASLLGRGARFFLVALSMAWLGPKVEPAVRRYIEWIGWATVVALVVVIWWYRWQG